MAKNEIRGNRVNYIIIDDTDTVKELNEKEKERIETIKSDFVTWLNYYFPNYKSNK